MRNMSRAKKSQKRTRTVIKAKKLDRPKTPERANLILINDESISQIVDCIHTLNNIGWRKNNAITFVKCKVTNITIDSPKRRWFI